MKVVSQVNRVQQMMQYSEAPLIQLEEANYVNNAQNGYQHKNYQGQNYQSQWRSQPQGQGNQGTGYQNQGN